MAAITITNAGRNLMRDGASGNNDPQIAYVAFGTSNTAPSASDTQLGAEVFRKAVTSYQNGATTGEILVSMYLAPSESVGTAIQEVGFFGGNSASATANSGVLLARGLYSHTHVGTESIQFQIDLTIS